MSARPAGARRGGGAKVRGGGASERAEPARPGLASRQVAARLLSAVVDARTSLDGLTDPSGGHPGYRGLEPRDQALVRAILATSLRFRGTIEGLVSGAIERPLPEGAVSLRHLLHVGAAQILFLDVPDSAAVDLAVAAANEDPRNKRFAGLVNAVLRRIAREVSERPHVPADPMADMVPWLRERLTAAYGEARAQAIARAHLSPAPVDLSMKADPAGWAERLGGRALSTGTVRLDRLDGPVTALPGFETGEWWVQDAAAAIPARLLSDIAGRRVADLCAAPGGKTAQLAAAGARVTAFDISASRLKRLNGNLQRLGLEVETRLGDIREIAPEPFDAVLLDAPCSSTGTIRRHPDVGWTKSAEEVEKLARVQTGLLDRAAEFVAPGGRLVFSNCSLDPAEGEAVVEAFLASRPEFSREPVAPHELPGLETAIDANGDVRTTPDMEFGAAEGAVPGLDGFFAARLRRNP